MYSFLIIFVLSNSIDPDEMMHYLTFHLGLHCFPKYLFLFTSIQMVNMNTQLCSGVSGLNFGLSLHLHLIFVAKALA